MEFWNLDSAIDGLQNALEVRRTARKELESSSEGYWGRGGPELTDQVDKANRDIRDAIRYIVSEED